MKQKKMSADMQLIKRSPDLPASNSINIAALALRIRPQSGPTHVHPKTRFSVKSLVFACSSINSWLMDDYLETAGDIKIDPTSNEAMSLLRPTATSSWTYRNGAVHRVGKTWMGKSGFKTILLYLGEPFEIEGRNWACGLLQIPTTVPT